MKTTHQITYGIHAVQAALQRDAFNVIEVIVESGRKDVRLQALLDIAAAQHVEVRRVSGKELDALIFNACHQGVVARCRAATVWQEADLEQLLEGLSAPPFLLVLDGVQDPHNLGACLRSADAAGVHAVIAPRDRAVGISPVVRKVASGAAETVPFIQVTNLARTLRTLKDIGLWTVGADAAEGDEGSDLFNADLRGPTALVMGAEGQGMRRLTKEHCDLLVRIPMQGTVESLNVSVATGICLFEVVRQRTMPMRSKST